MPLLHAIALDASGFVLAAAVMILTLQDSGHYITSADGLAIAAASLVMALGISRVTPLKHIHSCWEVCARQEIIFAVSTIYAMLLWTALQISMRFL